MDATQILRPMSMGTLLDRSASFWRRSVWPLSKLFLPFALFELAAIDASERLAARYLSNLQPGAAADPKPAELLLFAAAYLAFIGLVYLLSALASSAVSRYVGNLELGRPEPLFATIRQTLGKIWPLLAASITFCFWGALFSFLCCLPGMGLLVTAALAQSSWRLVLMALGFGLFVIGFLAALLPWLLRLSFVGTLLGLETVPGCGVYRRTRQLLSGKGGPSWTDWIWVRASVTFTVMLLFMIIVGLLGQLPTDILRQIYGHSTFDLKAAAAVPLVFGVPAKLFALAVQCLFGPLQSVFLAFFYFDCRARKEGLDLELRLKALDQSRPAA
jgi:hypothetical protein